MKNLMLKKNLASLISIILMAVATSSSTTCISFIFDEPKMPKSLYKVD